MGRASSANKEKRNGIKTIRNESLEDQDVGGLIILKFI
jgi:hypothetical protein